MGDQEQQIRSYIDQINSLRRENDDLRNKLSVYADQEAKTRSYIDQINILRRENDDLRNELGRAQQTNIESQTHITNKYETKITEVNNRYVTIENKYNEILNNHRKLEDLLRDRDETIKRMADHIDAQEADGKKIYNSYIEANRNADDLRRENANYKNDLEFANEKIRNLEREIDQLRREKNVLTEEIRRI